MTRQVTVRDVVEQNDVLGRKYFKITAQESDETVPTVFEMTSVVGTTWDMLHLTTVSPEDVVEVRLYNRYVFDNETPVGEFFKIITPGYRVPICRCGTVLACDGFFVKCPDPNCPLTALARLKVLADTPLIPDAYIPTVPGIQFPSLNPNAFGYKHELRMAQENDFLRKPFHSIGTMSFWGSGLHPSDVLLKYAVEGQHISLSTFLVDYELKSFIDSRRYTQYVPDVTWERMGDYHETLREMCQRRDYNSHEQNHVFFNLLSALSIGYLSPAHISRLLQFECHAGTSTGQFDPFVIYASVLTSPSEMVRVLDILPIEAHSIFSTIHSRKNELYSIFGEYGDNEHIFNYFARLDRR